VPPAGARRDGLLRIVAANFHAAVSGDAERDILVYVAFPDSSPDAHAAVLPAVIAAAGALRANATLRFDAALFDGDVNDAPPPHGAGATAPTLVLYPAFAKGTPRYVQRFSDGQLTLYDVLYFVAATAGRADTSAAAAALLRELPDEALLARPWDAAAEEFEDDAWHRREEEEEEAEAEEEEEESNADARDDASEL
jgi:hypothetical protein